MNKVIHYIGLDVHKETIAVSIAPQNSTEVRRYGIIGGTLAAVDKLLKKLSREHIELRLVYEAGPCGFVLCRHLRNQGLVCEVVAPSLMPRKASDRVKTDRRDADQLARLYRAGELTAIDGSKFAAVNARDQNFNASKLEELMARADERLAEYLAQMDAADTTEPAGATLTQEKLAAKIAALQERREWHEELLGQLDTEQKQISVTDPDTRKMPTAHGTVVGYNAQVAVDAKHKLIAAEDVTNDVTDLGQLANVALEAKTNLELQQTDVVADAGYYNAAEVSRCVERGLTPYIPKADTSANTARGLYGKSQFKYDAAQDVYVCPAGAVLTYRFATYELGRELKYYRASGCKTCALKSRCTRNQANRTITREENEHLMEAMAARMKQQPGKFKLRKMLAEHPFGTIKRWFGYTHFLLKGLGKVQCEWSLTTLAYNLKRVLNLVSFQKLMAAVG